MFYARLRHAGTLFQQETWVGHLIGIIYAAGGLGGTISTLAMNGLIQRVGPAWTFRIFGFMILATGVPAALVIKERVPINKNAFIDK